MTPMQQEILRAIELHGGVTSLMTEKNGWTRNGHPTPDMAALVRARIIAPRILTSQPISVVWQLRSTASHKPTLARIEQEARRLGIKEYAPGGFQLTTRWEDERKRRG